MRAQPSLLRGAPSAGVSAGALWHLHFTIFLSFLELLFPISRLSTERNLAYNLNAACIDLQLNRAETEGERGGGRERGRERESVLCEYEVADGHKSSSGNSGGDGREGGEGVNSELC